VAQHGKWLRRSGALEILQVTLVEINFGHLIINTYKLRRTGILGMDIRFILGTTSRVILQRILTRPRSCLLKKLTFDNCTCFLCTQYTYFFLMCFERTDNLEFEFRKDQCQSYLLSSASISSNTSGGISTLESFLSPASILSWQISARRSCRLKSGSKG